MSKNIFFTGLILAASGILPPPVALLVGLVYGFTFVHPYHIDARKLSKMLLQVSVVGLGFGMNLHQVIRAGQSGFLYTVISIGFAMILGTILGKLLFVKQRISFLISVGTAICGEQFFGSPAEVEMIGYHPKDLQPEILHISSGSHHRWTEHRGRYCGPAPSSRAIWSIRRCTKIT